MSGDLRGRLAAAVSMLPNLDALERVVDDETRLIRDTLTRRTQAMHRTTEALERARMERAQAEDAETALAETVDRVRAELDKRRPDTLVSVRLVRHWLDGPTEERP